MIIEAGDPDAVRIPRPASLENAVEPSACGSGAVAARDACFGAAAPPGPGRRRVPRGARRGVSRRGGNPRPTWPTRLSSEGE